MPWQLRVPVAYTSPSAPVEPLPASMRIGRCSGLAKCRFPGVRLSKPWVSGCSRPRASPCFIWHCVQGCRVTERYSSGLARGREKMWRPLPNYSQLSMGVPFTA